MSQQAKSELAPTGTLRAGINLSNGLLVTGTTPSGDPTGLAPDLAREVATRLGVPIAYVTYAEARNVADAAARGEWDIGLIGAEPEREATIAFTPAYAEIEVTCMVPPGSPIKSFADIDRPGHRIAVTTRSAYHLWLERHIRHAQLVHSPTLNSAYEQFAAENLEILAGIRPRLLADAARMPGATILPGQITSVRQSIGSPRWRPAPSAATGAPLGAPPAAHSAVGRDRCASSRTESAPHAAAFLTEFVEQAKASGLIADLINRHHINGLSIPP